MGKHSDIERSRPLQKMFMSVPPSYDFLNRLLTFRLDECWRKKAANALLRSRPLKLLDLCTGTGDLAIRLARDAPAATAVTAVDFSRPMLAVARKKALHLQQRAPEFVFGDIAALPFESASFDAAGIAFAFRNLTYKNPDTAVFLQEILRILKPGGHFVVVETSQPKSQVLRMLTHFYLRSVTIPLGGLISGHRAAYKYLAHSAIHYYTAEQVRQILMDAGFTTVNYRLLLGGVAAIWEAKK